MARELVALKKVVELLPIEGADNIELAHVENTAWNLIVRKGDFKIGDIGLLFEIDSAIEQCEPLAFMPAKKRYCPQKGTDIQVHIIKTKLLRGVVSQGLLMKPELFGLKNKSSYDAEQLRMILHVHHIDDLMNHAANTHTGNTNNGVELLPLLGFVPVTDQKRIESDTSMFEKYKDRKFSVELKADGSSMSVFYVDKDIYPTQFGVTSHRRFIKRIQRPWYDVSAVSGKLNKLCALCKKAVMHVLHKDKPVYLPTNNQFILKAEELNLEQLFKVVYDRTHRNLVYQGELIGPGIQSNRDSRSKSHWLLFDIYDVDERRYMTPGEKHNFYYAYLFPYVEHVKVISRERQVLSEFPNADAMQELATVKTHKGNLAEGIVVKSEDMPYVSFKCVSRKYLLTGGHRDN